MRILQGADTFDEIELHLTDVEAQQVIAGLTDCLDDLATVGLSQSHTPITDERRESHAVRPLLARGTGCGRR
jgi:hypothetical protein